MIAAVKARTALALGLRNVLRVTWYRLGLKYGFAAVQHIEAALPRPPFVRGGKSDNVNAGKTNPPGNAVFLFGWRPLNIEVDPPNWHANSVTGAAIRNASADWWRIADFDDRVGDIKTIWEVSRFDWVIVLAQRIATGDEAATPALNNWLSDWVTRNPPYKGPNWKCGQEASIRVMHLAMAALIIGEAENPCTGLCDLIEVHLKRIAPTIGYALAQDNNHGTSEAAALFIGGSWLQRLGIKSGASWYRAGRKWLENRAIRLIEPDGSFSQYSSNYHRLLLDTFNMVEIWRRTQCLQPLSESWLQRASAATQWLAAMVQPVTGDVPNLGANDGARLLPVTRAEFRDYRPSLHLSTALFLNHSLGIDGDQCGDPLRWFGMSSPERVVETPTSRVFNDGGYAVLRRGDTMALLRYPRFRFRPSHADALHLDLWRKGDNLLRDAGSYSYNTNRESMEYFTGTASHNTIQFDDREQMPRLGRFLFGRWLKTHKTEPLLDRIDQSSFSAAYCDSWGAYHRRRVILTDIKLSVLDSITGFAKKAVLRWRLSPGSWQIDDGKLSNGQDHLTVTSSIPIERMELVEGWESRYYLQKTPVPILEVEVRQPGELVSEYVWAT